MAESLDVIIWRGTLREGHFSGSLFGQVDDKYGRSVVLTVTRSEDGTYLAEGRWGSCDNLRMPNIDDLLGDLDE